MNQTQQARSTVILALGAVVMASGCSTVRYTEAFTPTGHIEAVVVRVDQGTVDVRSGEQVWVERTVRAPEGTLELNHDLVDGVLTIEARCTTPIPCAVDTELVLPYDMPLSVDLGEGRVWTSGLTKVDVQLGVGEAELNGASALYVQVGQGSVRASVASGAQARLAVGSGDLAVQVPGAVWDVQLSARDTLVEGVDHTPGAAGSLELTAPGGTVQLQAVAPLAHL